MFFCFFSFLFLKRADQNSPALDWPELFPCCATPKTIGRGDTVYSLFPTPSTGYSFDITESISNRAEEDLLVFEPMDNFEDSFSFSSNKELPVSPDWFPTLSNPFSVDSVQEDLPKETDGIISQSMSVQNEHESTIESQSPKHEEQLSLLCDEQPFMAVQQPVTLSHVRRGLHEPNLDMRYIRHERTNRHRSSPNVIVVTNTDPLRQNKRLLLDPLSTIRFRDCNWQ